MQTTDKRIHWKPEDMSSNQNRIPLDNWSRVEGSALPLGATWFASEQAYNFSIYSKNATSVSLLLYQEPDFTVPAKVYRFSFPTNKTSRVWHMLVPAAEIGEARYYAYKLDGPFNPVTGDRFDDIKILLDPYARRIFLPPDFSRRAACAPGPNDGKAPLGILPDRTFAAAKPQTGVQRHTHDLVIYELHVRNFTRHSSCKLDDRTRGTYAGVGAMVPYLKELGVTAVELMPVHQCDLQEGSHWGYMPLGFFAPHHLYAENADAHAAPAEFREMVEALHRAGIEVILDVVYNHTTEGDRSGPTYSFRGIDNSTYYALDHNDLSQYVNFSACGNDLRNAHPLVRKLVFDSLHYWATEIGIDGFRFDLASIFMRDSSGSLNYHDPAIIAEITGYFAKNVRLIAEPWQGEPGSGYVLGRSFPGLGWQQWNGKFRDDLRGFVKGDNGLVSAVMTRLYGSTDLFPDDLANASRPSQSVNFVTCHDGMCLNDLVSYTNDSQGSWNCGWEGDSDVPEDVIALRKRQVKNFFALLMLANGTPMFRAGDEFMNTQCGDPNPYRRDDETVWLDWRRLELNRDIFRFFKQMIAFRKCHPSIGRSGFWRDQVHWYGVTGQPDLSHDSHTLAFFLSGSQVGDDDLYVMINAFWQNLDFVVQEGTAEEWLRVIDTSRSAPEDISEPERRESLSSIRYKVAARSVVVLMRSRSDKVKPQGDV
ncbi:MAG: isoamylase [Candidatus Binataceae bacterium]|jgi:glycogen operon protein